jgi:uncharacterized protein involved in tolerance to divalent cations
MSIENSVFRCKKTENLIVPMQLWYKWRSNLSSEDHDCIIYCKCGKTECKEIKRQVKACSKYATT